MKNTMSVPRAFAVAAGTMMAVAVVGGLWLAGSPAKERDRQFDQRRENDLQQIAGEVDAYFGSHSALPESLEAIRASGATYYPFTTVDPVTREQYEYRAISDATFELCATFDAESGETDMYGNPRMPVPMMEPSMAGKGGYRSWIHGAGRTCFTLEAVGPMGQSTCSITNPCAAGQSCVTLPGRNGAVCVPQGKECLAAKCDGQCTIAESYPAQVRCAAEATAPVASPKKPAGSSTCDLMENKKSGKVDCFGCANGICKNAPAGWMMFERDPDSPSIPYACFESEQGCQLAQ